MINVHIEQTYGVGFGNLVQFIPTLLFLKTYCNVSSNSQFYLDMGLTHRPFKKDDIDEVIVPHWPANWRAQIRLRRKYPKTPILMPQMRAKGRHWPTLLTRSYPVDLNKPEPEQYQQIFGHSFNFKYLGWIPRDHLIILGTSGKANKQFKYLNTLWNNLENLGFDVLMIGEHGIWYNHYREMFEAVQSGTFYFGVDCGLMHLCDILGMPGIVLWGDTWKKSQPVNNIQTIEKGLDLGYQQILSTFMAAYESAWGSLPVVLRSKVQGDAKAAGQD